MLGQIAIKNLVKLPLYFLFGSLMVSENSGDNSRNNTSDCIGAQPFCSEQIYIFQNSTNTSAPSGIDFGCVNSADNPVWYYMEVGQAGTIRLKIQQTSQPNGQGRTLDVDFAMWGPYQSYDQGCRAITSGDRPIQSSYSTNSIEYVGIGTMGGSNGSCSNPTANIGQSSPPAAQQGEIYIILLTNYSGETGYITFNQEGGTGGANCEIVNPCSFSGLTATANCVGNEIEYTGSISFTDAPDEGTLTVSAADGGSQTFTAPFTSPINYSFRGINNEIRNTNVSVTFSEDACTKTTAVEIQNLITPTFNIVPEICFGDNTLTLPTQSTNGITGTWDLPINSEQTTVYTFTPNAGQCALPATHTISIKAMPTVTINTTQTEICSNYEFIANLSSNYPNTTYTWQVIATNVSGAIPGNGNTINHTLQTVNPNGGSVVYIVTPTANGCVGQPVEYTVRVNPKPSVFAPASFSICSGDDAVIELSSSFDNITYTYTVEQFNVSGASDGQGATIQQNLQTQSENGGEVIYTITPHVNGCKGDSVQVKVRVNANKPVTLDGGYICFDRNGNLTNSFTLNSGITSNYSFKWFKDDVEIVGAISANYVVQEVGHYYVELTNLTTGCTSNSNTVYVANSLTEHQTRVYVNNSLEFGSIEIETMGNGDYLFQLNNNGFQPQNTFNNLLPGVYRIEVVDQNGCYQYSKEITVISYPNFFTPNGDGINDTWNIWSLGNNLNAEILIFDKKGTLIKQITPRGEGWDGTKNGKALPSTDYWFVVKYQDGRNNEWRTFKSHFSLKR